MGEKNTNPTTTQVVGVGWNFWDRKRKEWILEGSSLYTGWWLERSWGVSGVIQDSKGPKLRSSPPTLAPASNPVSTTCCASQSSLRGKGSWSFFLPKEWMWLPALLTTTGFRCVSLFLSLFLCLSTSFLFLSLYDPLPSHPLPPFFLSLPSIFWEGKRLRRNFLPLIFFITYSKRLIQFIFTYYGDPEISKH